MSGRFDAFAGPPDPASSRPSDPGTPAFPHPSTPFPSPSAGSDPFRSPSVGSDLFRSPSAGSDPFEPQAADPVDGGTRQDRRAARTGRGGVRAVRPGLRWRLTIGGKVGLLTGALVGVLAISSAVLLNETRVTADEYNRLIDREGRQSQLALQMSVEFKQQVQEWKDILLRGSDPTDLATYEANFQAQDRKVDALYDLLRTSDPDPQLKAELADYHRLELAVDAGYTKALQVFQASGGKDVQAADRLVRGIDRPPTEALAKIVADRQTVVGRRVVEVESAAATRQRNTLIVVSLMLVVLAAGLAVALIRIVRPIRSLTREAFRAASDRLPGAIAAVKAMDDDAEPPTLPPFRVRTQDELRDLGNALTTLQDSALALALEQHRTDRETSDMLINLGRRNQNLLGRMLSYVTELERREQNPEILSQLFQLDHAATRIRRNAESMLVLAGATQTRTWSRPVPCIDVVRAALSEIEEYVRVDLHHVEEGSVTGVAVADVVHLLAELVENATHFSPPNTQVTVIGQRVREGYRIRVIDQGVGMTRRELDESNQRISNADSGWSDAKLLGLYVVGRLARRRGIQVALEPSAGRGITASVLLPETLLGGAGTGAGGQDRSSEPASSASAGPEPVAPPAGGASGRNGRTPVTAGRADGSGLSSMIDLTAVEARPPRSPVPASVPSQWFGDDHADPGTTTLPRRVRPSRTDPTGTDPAGPDRTSSDRTGTDFDRTGTDFDRTGTDRTGGGASGTAPSGLGLGLGVGLGSGRSTAPAPSASHGSAIPRRVRGAQLPDLGPAPDPVIAASEQRVVEPESLRWQLRSFQLDVEAARRAYSEGAGGPGRPAPPDREGGAARAGDQAETGEQSDPNQRRGEGER